MKQSKNAETADYLRKIGYPSLAKIIKGVEKNFVIKQLASE